jgi:HlyD family secretion protein
MRKHTPFAGLLLGMTAILSVLFFSSCRKEEGPTTVSASGTIEVIEVTVSAKTSGQVDRLLVDEGSQVKSGDILAVVDSASLQIQLEQAEGGVGFAEAQLELLLKGARIEDIRQAEAALKQAEANLKLARENRDRIHVLFEKAAATPQQNDDAETRLAVAVAQHGAAQQALEKLIKFARPEDIKSAQARLDQAVAARDLLKKTISDATIVSPQSGIVTTKITEQGEYVGPGTPLVTIADLSRVHLNIYITETELGKVRLGQEAEVTIDSYPGRVFTGRVIFISPEAEFTPKNVQTKEERVKLVYRVKVEIPNPENILKPGMPADALIRVEPAASS